MTGETPQEFIDTLSYGMEQAFVYRGRTMCVQGWREESGVIYCTLDLWDSEDDKRKDGSWKLWEFRASTPDECVEAFLAAPLFDGRTFWEAEGEIEVIFA